MAIDTPMSLVTTNFLRPPEAAFAAVELRDEDEDDEAEDEESRRPARREGLDRILPGEKKRTDLFILRPSERLSFC